MGKQAELAIRLSFRIAVQFVFVSFKCVFGSIGSVLSHFGQRTFAILKSRAVLLSLLFLIVIGTLSTVGQTVPAYSHRRPIAIDHTKVSNSDQSNFPVLISGTFGYLATVANGGQVQNTHGYDIIFSTDAAGSNQLDHEMESYDPATGTVNFWVRIPFLSHTTDTVIFVQYGNSAITASQENRAGVWNGNYQMVLHLDEPASPYRDSTSNGFSSTGGSYPVQAAGKIGQGQSFNGGQYIAYSQAQSPNPASSVTLEAWIKTTDTSSKAIVGKWGNDGNGDADQAYELYMDSNAMPGVALKSTNLSAVAFSGTTHINDGAWHHLVATAPSTGTIDIYVDGLLSGSLNTANPLLATTVDRLLIGAGSIVYGPYYLNGVLDEVRISNSVRSADWIATEYNNQNSPSSFYSLGNDGSSMVVFPRAMYLTQGKTQQFGVADASNSAVVWSISPAGAGSIDSSGMYTAPASVASSTVVTVTAVSATDSADTSTAVVNLIDLYNFHRPIVIDHTKVSNSDQSNFPVLISGTFGYLATVANGGRVQNSRGYDISFSTDVEGLKKLDYEMESYDPLTGTVNCWVRIPFLSHTADTMIFVQYGKSSITTSQENRAGVWDANYKGVWHFANDASLNVNDSTGNGNNGINSGATPVAGQIGGAGSFNGSSEVDIATSDSVTGSFTLEGWIKQAPGGAGGLFGSRRPQEFGFDVHVGVTGSSEDIGAGNTWLITGTWAPYAFSADSWHQVAYTVNPGGYSVYIDGLPRSSGVLGWHTYSL